MGFAAGAVGATGGFGQEEGLLGTGVSAVRPDSGLGWETGQLRTDERARSPATGMSPPDPIATTSTEACCGVGACLVHAGRQVS